MIQNKRVFSNVMSALITPFNEDGSINRKAVKEMVDFELNGGLKGFYVCGSTGEGPVMNAKQRKDMAEAAIEANAGRGKVIIHVGAINCEEAFDLARHAAKAGADGISSVAPTFYFKYTKAEIIDFYKRLAAQCDLPMIIYAAPMLSLDGIREVMAELLKTDTIVGIKDTRANYYEMWRLRQLNDGNINIINGPDESLICGLTMGADGGIGSTYNLMPDRYAKLYRLFTEGKWEEARACQTEINKVISVLLEKAKFNCIGTIKLAFRLMGIDAGKCCYPAEDFNDAEIKDFRAAMNAAGYKL